MYIYICIWYIDISLRWFLIRYYLHSNTHFQGHFEASPTVGRADLEILGTSPENRPFATSLWPPARRDCPDGCVFSWKTWWHTQIANRDAFLHSRRASPQCWLQLLVVAWCERISLLFESRTSLISQQGTSLSSLLRLTWPRMVPHKMVTLGNMRINHGQVVWLSPGPRRARSCWMRRLLGDAIFGFWRPAAPESSSVDDGILPFFLPRKTIAFWLRWKINKDRVLP